jgi:hypothetical protein
MAKLSISGRVLIILESPFTKSMEERDRFYSFILSRTLHETVYVNSIYDYTDLQNFKIAACKIKIFLQHRQSIKLIKIHN